MTSRPRPGLSIPVVAAFLILAASPASPGDSASPATQTAPAARTPGFDPAALDRAVDPCSDFYRFACGGWLDANPIPPDRGSWGRFAELQERNLAILHDILEKAASPDPKRSPVQRQTGDYYAACMDEKTIEERGAAVLQPDLERIASLETKAGLAAVIGRLQREGVNLASGGSRAPSLPFRFGSEQDFKDATSVIAVADQGGLGLPDREYYLKEDDASVGTRKRYREHVARVFELVGDSPELAAGQAAAVIEIETALARSSMELVKRRDPANVYHKMTRKELEALAPSFAWGRYFEAIGAPRFAGLNVRVPDFFEAMEAALQSASLDDWKSYLRWHLVRAWSPFLPAAFVDEDFDFYGRTLGGARELAPRWKRCVQFTDQNLGEALGRPYVEATFGADGKRRTQEMVRALEKAMGEDIEQLPWMTGATKKRALAKLQAITNKIGYPDEWRDYGGVKIARDDFRGNIRRLRAFEFRRELTKIGKPVDRNEWFMSPPTVNAYYDPQMNNINFPAGILQPPFFDRTMDDPVNFGGIGMVIGHELTHGFDDQGRKFDPRGNLRDWWTEEDAREFEKRTACLVEEYSDFTAVGDVKINGRLTLGENTADNGGLRIAHLALRNTLAGRPERTIDGFAPRQRFFLGYAQIWCSNVSDELARLQAQTNPHSLPKYRVNGVVSNLPEFRDAFGCQEGAPMVRNDACRVW